MPVETVINRKFLSLVAFLIFTPVVSPAQTYNINIRAGAGYSRFLTDMDYPGINKNGFTGSLRLMWQPEHLLSIGLESGYNTLYTYEQEHIDTEFGTTDATSSLSSIPIFFVITMQIYNDISITGGWGTAFLKTSFDSFDLHSGSTQVSTCYFVAPEYEMNLNDELSLGAELRWYYIQKIEDGTLSMQISVNYRLLTW
jgi:hypothetical protein